MGHFDMPKLHALSHYSTWIRQMGTLNHINTALTEALRKTIKAVFRHSNKEDFISQMCLSDDQ
jgi:hypothetical protein